MESWDGTRWSVMVSPNPWLATSSNSLAGVSCTPSGSCTAVGTYDNYSKTLIESWNGTRWAVVPSPDPGPVGASTSDQLDAVTCPSPVSCTTTS
jgi:hypothetical protein